MDCKQQLNVPFFQYTEIKIFNIQKNIFTWKLNFYNEYHIYLNVIKITYRYFIQFELLKKCYCTERLLGYVATAHLVFIDSLEI